jgi:toxin secretion/phage lysis holin
MRTIWAWIQTALAAAGGWLGWTLGGMDGFLFALIAFTVADYATGVMRAILDKRLSSAIGARGIFKKVVIFIMVAVGHTLDTRLLGSGSAIRTAILYFFIANEGISLLENAAAIGLPVPQKLKDVLAQLHVRGSEGDGEH